MSIQVRNLTKKFGSFTAVEDATFQLQSGELVALLGPSGSGKSTILRMIAGLEAPDAGSILLKGEEATNLSPKERNIGFVFQHYALFKHMTVWENVAFGLHVRKTSKSEINERVREMINLVQLDGMENRYPSQLSGGQRQRVALARSLAPRPKVLLLDEPFGALDAKVRGELREWIQRLHEQSQLTTLFVTHDQHEALEIANKILVIHEGRIVQEGTPDEIFDRPATAFVAQFVGDSNFIESVVEEKGLVLWGPFRFSVDPKIPAGRPVRIYFRPNDVYVSSVQETLQVPATIRKTLFLGALIEMRLEVAPGKIIHANVPKGVFQASGFRLGQQVFVGITLFHVFEKNA